MTLNSNAGPGAAPSPLRLHFDRFPGFVEEYRALISLGGMFLKTQDLRPVGSQVTFDLRLSDGFRLIHGSGEVAWVRTTALGPEQEAGLAVRFQALDEKGRELVLKILEEQVKGGGTPFDVDEVPDGVVVTPGQPAAAQASPAVPAAPAVAVAPVAAEAAGDALEFSAPWEKLPEVPMDVLDEGAELAPPAAPAVPLSASPEESFELPAIDAPIAAPEPAVDTLEPPEIAFDGVDFDADPLDGDDDEPTFVGSVVELEPRPPESATEAAGFELEASESAFETGAFDGSGLSPSSDTSLETGAFDGSALEAPSFDDGPTFELEPEPVGTEAMGLSDPPGVPDFGTGPPAEDGVVDVRDTTRGRTPVDPMPTADEDTGEIDFGTADPQPGAWAPPAEETPAQPVGAVAGGVGFGGAGGFAPDAFGQGDLTDSASSAVDPSTFGGGQVGGDLGSVPGAAFQDSGVTTPTSEAAAPAFEAGDFGAPAAAFDTGAPAMTPTQPDLGTPSFDAVPSFDTPPAAAAGAQPAGTPASFEPAAATSGGLFDNPSPSGGLFGGSPADSTPGSFGPGESTEVLAEGSAPLAPTMAPFGAAEQPVAESTLSLDAPGHDDRYGFADYEEDLDGTAPKKSRGPLLRLALIGLLVVAVVGGYFFKDSLMGLVGLGEPAADAALASGSRPGPRPAGPAPTTPGTSADPSAPDAETADSAATDPATGLAADQEAGGTESQGGFTDSAAAGDLAASTDADLDRAGGGAGGVADPIAESPSGSTPASDPATTPPPPPPVRNSPPPPLPEPVPPPVVASSSSGRDTGRRSAPSGGGGLVIESITWSEGLRGTEVEIRLDGPVRADLVGHDLLAYKSTVEQVRIAGIDEDYFPATVEVGTASLDRVRVGLHASGGESEIRLVFDFPEPGPAIREVRVDGARVFVQVR